jgi:hypothetical protein
VQDPPERMGKRGMLPKFRPAALSQDAQARPSIRPLRASPPPPPPTPARRNPSGFGPRGGEGAVNDASAFLPFDDDDEHERSTAHGNGEPLTLDRAAETVPRTVPREAPNARRGRADAIALSFDIDEETQARDDETQARPIDEVALDKRRGAPRQADLGVDYDALPSLEVRPAYDTYEAAFSERDPVTQLHVQRESAEVRRSDSPAYREPSYDEPSFPAPYPSSAVDAVAPPSEQGWPRREESGPRERPVPDARAYAPPVPPFDDISDSARWARDNAQAPESMIPQPPRVPEELAPLHPAFAQGVQPIRPPTPDAWGTPHARNDTPAPPMHSPMPPAYAPQAHYGQQVQHPHFPQPQQGPYGQQPGASYPAPAYPSQMPPPMGVMHAGASGQMHAMSPSMNGVNRALPVTTPPRSTAAKVGRIAWFVAGAAFGLTFAFFATGVFTGGKAQSDFPAAPPLPPAATMTAPAPVAIAPVAPAPVAVAPEAPVVPAAPTSPPVAAPMAPPPVLAAPMAPPPVAAAPAPVAAAPAARPAPPRAAPRAQPPRRPAPPSAPVSQAPKNLGGGGPGADDEPRSPPSAPAGDIGDLLGAGLRP